MNSLVRARFTVLILTLIAAAAPRAASAQSIDGLSLSPAIEAASMLPAPIAAAPRAPERPAALVPLYVSFATLQALDTASTMRALNRGGSEANPLVAPVVGSPAAFIGAKAAASALAIAASERLWKDHRTLAIATMIGMNVGCSLVVAHNVRVNGHRLQ